jgi:hypothetical protein
MTYRVGNAFFSGAGFCCVAMAVALLALGGCGGGNTIDNAVPVAQGARDTGSYPNLNIKPEVAAQQFTDAERTAKLSELQAERAQAEASPGATTEAADNAELGKLAATHAGDTLKEIEAGQTEGKCDPALDPTCK